MYVSINLWYIKLSIKCTHVHEQYHKVLLYAHVVLTCRMVDRLRLPLQEKGDHGSQSPNHLPSSINQIPELSVGGQTLHVSMCIMVCSI